MFSRVEAMSPWAEWEAENGEVEKQSLTVWTGAGGVCFGAAVSVSCGQMQQFAAHRRGAGLKKSLNIMIVNINWGSFCILPADVLAHTRCRPVTETWGEGNCIQCVLT